MRYVERLCDLGHFGTNTPRVHPACDERKRQVFAGAHVRKQCKILEHHRQIAIGRRQFRNVAPADANFSGVGRLQPEQ